MSGDDILKKLTAYEKAFNLIIEANKKQDSANDYIPAMLEAVEQAEEILEMAGIELNNNDNDGDDL